MPKKKPRPFFFHHLSNKLVAEFLNIRHPINLKYNEDLLDRVASRYPLIDKSMVAVILQQFFQSWRDLLILGYSFELMRIFTGARLYFSTMRKNGVIYPTVKVQLTTPPPLKVIK